MKANKSYPAQLFNQAIRYEIPPYQRRYIWEQEKQWEPLWEDVRDTAEDWLEGRTLPHFMGAVVLDHRSGEGSVSQVRMCTVVDGQQRLTTIQLLLDAVQEAFERREFSDSAGRLARLVLNDQLFWANDPYRRFKIWPTIHDRDAFRHAMENDLPSEAYKDSSIVQAHDFFKDQVGLWLDTAPKEQRPARVAALEQAVSGLLELVVIEIEGDEDANAIFESLNARGTPLLQSDLIRNLVMQKASIGNDEEAAHRLWDFGDWWQNEIGRGFQARQRIDVFFNHWLTVRNSAEVKAYAEFASFESYVENSGRSIEDTASDIAHLAAVYEKIERHEFQDPDYAAFLHRRAVMQVGVLTPVLLWLFTPGVPDDQIVKCLKALESFLVRRMICGMQARSYNQLFIGLLQNLQNVAASECGDTVISYLAQQVSNANLWPGDFELANAFSNFPLYRLLTRGRLRLVLEGIEPQLRTNWAETQEVPHNLTIEHLMPQVWRGAYWPLPMDTDDEISVSVNRDRLVHSIGNLTLCTSPLNSSMSNGPWRTIPAEPGKPEVLGKREELNKHAVLSLNRELLDNAPDIWDETAIAERAHRLCQAAIKVWPHADGI